MFYGSSRKPSPLTPRQPEPAQLSCSETHEVPGGGGGTGALGRSLGTLTQIREGGWGFPKAAWGWQGSTLVVTRGVPGEGEPGTQEAPDKRGPSAKAHAFSPFRQDTPQKKSL